MVAGTVLYTDDVQTHSTREPQAPERALEEVAARLKRHRLWDWTLPLLPLLALSAYVPIFLHATGVLEWETMMGIAAGVLSALLLIIAGAQLKSGLPIRRVAGLLDREAAAKERFLTLATIDPARHSEPLRERLRAEASTLFERLNLKRKFPYRVKKPFWGSVVASAVLLLLFHLFFYVYSVSTPASLSERLNQLARELAQQPQLAPLANELENFARRFQDPKLKPEQKQSMIEQIRQEIEQQKNAQQQDGATKDSLQRAEQALEGLEKGTQGKEKGEGGGGLSTNLEQKGAGQGKESKGSGGAGQGDQAVMSQREQQDGKPMKPSQGQEKGASQAGQGQGESQKQELNTKKESEGAERGQTEGKGGKTREGEIPTGPAPDRFKRPGEQGEEGIRGAGYVTVELPEDIGGSSKSGRVEGKKTARTSLPVSNVPLPPGAGPEGAREKQQLPLEYRGLIR